MIGKLKGTVDAVGESHLIIDVGGVGYEVQASARTLRNVQLGDTISLTIDTHVREDAITLFGFNSEVERSWFRTLQSVQGIGAKVALAMLGILSPQELAGAITLGNVGAIEQTPKVGKKLAQRVVTELQDKAPALAVSGFAGGGAASDDGSVITGPQAGTAAMEAISGLINLSYQPVQASQAVAIAVEDLGGEADTGALIKRALKELSR